MNALVKRYLRLYTLNKDRWGGFPPILSLSRPEPPYSSGTGDDDYELEAALLQTQPDGNEDLLGSGHVPYYKPKSAISCRRRNALS